METTLLQIWGGVFYLLNKIFLTFSERAKKTNIKAARNWRISSWSIYLAGLPPWIILFVDEHNWIAASVEAAGAPGMLLGLVTALTRTANNPPKWLDRVAMLAIPFGLGYSLYDFGGLTALSQWLELALVLGFLVGTYLLARERRQGYLWYVLMHVACGWLMWTQDYPWLFWQQVVSLGFIFDAYRKSK